MKKGVSTAGRAGGPAGAVAAKVAAKTVVPAAAGAAEDEWGHVNDDRETAIRHASPYRAALAGAVAMAADPEWAAALRPTSALSSVELASLDPASPSDQRRFRAWLAAQDPVVAEALAPLFG